MNTKTITEQANQVRQAIYTKYIPATNTRGSRIKASCEAGSITIPYPSAENESGAHIHAAEMLCKKLADKNVKEYKSKDAGNAWLKPRVCGGLPNNKGYAHVFLD